MHRGVLAAAVAIALLLSGCVSSSGGPAKAREPETPRTDACVTGCQSDPPLQAPPSSQGEPSVSMTIRGIVTDKALRPIPTARVEIAENGRAQNVTASGTFELTGLVPSNYFVTATAPGYGNQTLSVAHPKGQAQSQTTLEFILERLPTNTAYHDDPVRFHGHIECALEVLIITPSCDTILTADPLSQDPLLNGTFSALLPVGPGWKTVVVDVVFDPANQPGFDGLRVTARGSYDPHQLGTYEKYGQFIGADDFTFRIEPGQSYEEGDKPVPSNTTMFQLDTYPHSHGWHAVCDPRPDGDCFLGVGAGIDVDFDLYMTVFYGEPAPVDWSLAKNS